MNARAEPAAAQKYALELSRVFNAPPSLVFKAFTRPEHLVRWWGPKDFSTSVEKLEFREGGGYRFTIHGLNDRHHKMSGVYREIAAPKTIAFTFAWVDEKGEPGDETLIIVTLKAEGNGTRLTFRQEPFDDAENRDSHAEGWGEVLDKLAPFLADFRG